MPATITFRSATVDDLDIIVSMLADDHLGQLREQYTQPLPVAYATAFRTIDADPNNDLVVACADGEVVGVMQLTRNPFWKPRRSGRGGKKGCPNGARIFLSQA